MVPGIGTPHDAPKRLVIVGAAAGIGRWFGENVLTGCQWESVTLLDASDAIFTTTTALATDTATILRSQVRASAVEELVIARLRDKHVAVVFGIPLDTLRDVASWLLPLLDQTSTIVDLSHDRLRADEILRSIRTDVGIVGVHALVGIAAPSADGQTFVVSDDSPPHEWLRVAIEASGGTVNAVTATRHDEIMRYVQTAAHHALLSFVDVVHQSGLDLERDLWANRTPVFEVLLALASRVLTPGQDATTASIQKADPTHRISDAFAQANANLAESRATDMRAYLSTLRDPFPGSLFTKMTQVGSLATGAVQATRTEISRKRRADGLVGVRSITGSDKLHVGHIEAVTPTSFVLREILVGQPGRASLLVDDAAIANARKLGIGGKPKTVEFALGRVRLLSSDELETELDTWLPTVNRGIKLLVPESISGLSAVHVAASIPGIVRAQLVSEEVRLGQREIVVRIHARSDRNLDVLERAVSAQVDEVFVWPDGVVLPVLETTNPAIGFLGPVGTFSDTAARQFARLLPRSLQSVAERHEFSDFATILEAVAARKVGLAVVPIANSSSGLVDLAAGALLSASPDLVAGGVVDVLVRFDAYVAPGTGFSHGMTVYTHPQVIRQCSNFIAANDLRAIECTSTTEACRLVKEQGHGVAIANVGLQVEVGLDVARASVGNLAGAVTRFLVVGHADAFGDAPRVDATLRSVWVVADPRSLAMPSGARFDELLHGPSGRLLLVSTASDRLPPSISETTRFLGTFPWSPRTPVVVVS